MCGKGTGFNNQPARISPWQAMNASCAAHDRHTRDRTILADKRSYIIPLKSVFRRRRRKRGWRKRRSLFSALLQPIPAFGGGSATRCATRIAGGQS